MRKEIELLQESLRKGTLCPCPECDELSPVLIGDVLERMKHGPNFIDQAASLVDLWGARWDEIECEVCNGRHPDCIDETKHKVVSKSNFSKSLQEIFFGDDVEWRGIGNETMDESTGKYYIRSIPKPPEVKALGEFLLTLNLTK